MLLWDVIRHSFPKGLRFCLQCRILHSQLFYLLKRHRSRRFVPKAELTAILDGWKSVPYPIMKNRVIRSLLLLRWCNNIRALLGKQRWLISHGVETEHAKIVRWVGKQANIPVTVVDSSGVKRKRLVTDQLEREKLITEVLEAFHVAKAFHFAYVFFLLALLFLAIASYISSHLEPLLALRFKYVEKRSKEDVMAYWREVVQRHVMCELHPSYSSLLPQPCTVDPKNNNMVRFTVVEMESPAGTGHRVLFIPTPVVGPERFYREIGKLMRSCNGLLIEGCKQRQLPGLPPHTFFPFKDELFGNVGLCHRFYDILSTKAAPPKLFGSGRGPSMLDVFLHGCIPMSIRYVYKPRIVLGHRADAESAWRTIRHVFRIPIRASNPEDEKRQQEWLLKRGEEGDVGGVEAVTSLAVPWSLSQILNLEASLIHAGWRVVATSSVEWMPLDFVGETFCAKFW